MHSEIINFWFKDVDKSSWFVKSNRFDQLIIDKYSAIHEKAMKGELYEWRATAKGRLAEIIILDQFSRNMFRDTAKSFASDILALVLSQEAVLQSVDNELTQAEKNFLYMPYMHSESLKIHEITMGLYERNGSESTLNFEIKHRDIIEKFGRYPHRNAILGRKSTTEEITFLSQPNSAF